MKILLIFLLLLATSAYSYFDAQVLSAVRSFPKSGYVEVESGHNLNLWKKDKIRYGFVRTSLSASTAGSYNSIKGDLEVAPISFISFGAGYEHIQNRQNYSDSDCNKYSCKIDLRRKYIRAQVLGGYKSLLMALNYNRSFYTPIGRTNSEGFIDPYSQLSMAKNGDSINTLSTAIGTKLGENYKLLFLSINGKVKNSDTSYSHNTLLIDFERNAINLFGGLGFYRATGLKTKPSALAGIKWTFKKGMGL